jgi:MurNAc alpha-1-phosphate uridylyltransferase
MIFAAGFGTRMKALTRHQPKPMIKVAGRPMIDHALTLARSANCNPSVTNLHYKAEVLQQHLASENVVLIVEQPDILETGGGLRNALPKLGLDPVFTMNADAIWAGPNPLSLLAEAWQPDRMDALLMTVPVTQAIGYSGIGDFSVAKNGLLARGAGAVYGGVQIIKTDGLNRVPERSFSLNVLWDRMLQDGRLFGLTYPGQWCDVGHPSGVSLAEEMLEQTDV